MLMAGERQDRQSLPLGRQWEMVVHGIPKGMLIIDLMSIPAICMAGYNIQCLTA